MLRAQFFKGNRKKLLQKLGADSLVVITAQSLMQRNSDTAYPFRQDSNFYYLTGSIEPDAVLILHAAEEFIILPKRSHAETVFGGVIDRDSIAEISGISDIYEYQEGWSRYKKLQQNRSSVYILGAPPARVTHTDSFFTNGSRRRLNQKLKRDFPAVKQIDIRPTLLKLRQIKQAEEIEAIKHSISITAEGFKLAKNMLVDGVHGYEIEAEFIKMFRQNNAEHAYGPIIAPGNNAVDLHYMKNTARLSAGEFILMDVGAEYKGYAADITRTYRVGEVTTRHQDVYDAVRSVMEKACSLLRDGLLWRDYAVEVDAFMGQHLIKLGLIQENSRQEVHKYFGHGISHNLGLDVHDVCDYQSIEENMVITVEPGIYIPEEGIGVRIEDNILITKDGFENLSSHIAYE